MPRTALHLSAAEESRLIELNASIDDLLSWVLHLLTCTACRRRLTDRWPIQSRRLAQRLFDDDTWPGFDVTELIGNEPRCHEERQRLYALLQERLEGVSGDVQRAQALWRELQAQSIPRQQLWIRNCVRFHNLALAWLIIERARSLWERSPREALESLETAKLILDRLSTAQRSARSGVAVRAFHLIYRANCKRILSDLCGAETDFQAARSCLDVYRQEATENHAVLWEFWASLRREQQRYDMAAMLIVRSRTVYERIGDYTSVARTLLAEAANLREVGRAVEALALLDELTVGPMWDRIGSRNRFIVSNNRLGCLVDLGRAEEALRGFPPVQELARSFADDFQVIRLEWLQGEIFEGVGRLESAAESYEKVMGFYLRQEVPFDAAVASLDLAAVLLRLGRLGRVVELVGSVLPLFEAQSLPRFSLAALHLFSESVQSSRATASLAREIADYLLRARARPDERFVPSTTDRD